MPALPSRPSTTIARRCAASCTDRTCTGSLGFHALSLSKSGAATPDPYRAAAHSVCSCHPAGVCYRRIFLLAAGSGEGPLTEPTTAVRRRQRDRRRHLDRRLVGYDRSSCYLKKNRARFPRTTAI